MTELSIKNEIIKKELQLNALIEITQAINSNVSEESFYKIFNFTLRSNLRITKLALFVLGDQWNCKVSFGTRNDFRKIELKAQYTKIKNTHLISTLDDSMFHEFNTVIPVVRKLNTLALVFIGRAGDKPFDDNNIKFIQAISNITIIAIENKKLAQKQLLQEAFRKELEIAKDVQQLLFPRALPNTNRIKIEASYLPHDRVGGDYYDYIPITADKFFICVADVSGKGIPAAIMMSNFQASLHTLIRQTINLKDIVKDLNRQVLESTQGKKFITFFGAIYDMSAKTMLYVNAGHNPTFLYRKKQSVQLLSEGSTVLGAIHPLPDLKEGIITDIDDFLLFAYTDGLTETINEQEEQFGQRDVVNYLSDNRHKDLKDIHRDIIAMLDKFKGKNGYLDDITMLSCRVVNK